MSIIEQFILTNVVIILAVIGALTLFIVGKRFKLFHSFVVVLRMISRIVYFGMLKSIIKDIKLYFKDLENSDLKRIKVSSSGDFSMSSKDIFNDKSESKELINDLRVSVEAYTKKIEVKAREVQASN